MSFEGVVEISELNNTKQIVDEFVELTNEKRRSFLAGLQGQDIELIREFISVLVDYAGDEYLGMLKYARARENSTKEMLMQQLPNLVKVLPQVDDGKTALDREFEDQIIEFNAIVDDMNDGKIESHQFHELLHKNLAVEGKVLTFLAFAAAKLDERVLERLLNGYEKVLNPKVFKEYLTVLNQLSEDAKLLDVFGIYLDNHQGVNVDYRLQISKDNEKLLKKFQRKIALEKDVVDVQNIDTHLASTHKSADQSHVAAFKRMLEVAKIPSVKARVCQIYQRRRQT